MQMNIARVDVTTLQERVYQQLRAALHQGRFALGEPITIRTLARALGTSEMPVREALKRLVAERALTQAPNRSFRVMPITRARLDELTQIRITLEGMAARLAARHADAVLLEKLRLLNDEMRAALSDHDETVTLGRNQELHFTIYRAAQSPQLFELIEGLWLRSGPFLAAAFAGQSEPWLMFEQAVRVHGRLLRAIARRDEEAAFKALALDLTAAAAWYVKHCAFPAEPDATLSIGSVTPGFASPTDLTIVPASARPGRR